VTTADMTAWPATTNQPGGGFVVLEAASAIVDVFKDYTSWIVLPEEPADPASAMPGLIRQTRELTGWAQRDLAYVLGTSHTTVRRLETDGRVTARTRGIAARAAELHAVILRLARAAGGPERLVIALGRTVAGTTPLDLLRAGEWSRAYTAALDAVHGPRPAMLGASRTPVKPATRELRP